MNVRAGIGILALVAFLIMAYGFYKVLYDTQSDPNRYNPYEDRVSPDVGTMENINFRMPKSAIHPSKHIQVFAGNEINNTEIRIEKGSTVSISATGKVNAATESNDGAFAWVNPDGWSNEPEFNSGRSGPSASAFMGLVARISKSQPPIDDNGWTFIGSEGKITAQEDGVLYFTVNDKIKDASGVRHPEWFSNNQGSFMVKVKIN